jgi:invasion protein IalB
MMKNRTLLTGMLLAIWAMPAIAAEPQLIKTFRDWDAFTQGEGATTTCYMASVAKKSRPSTVNHGEVYVTVAHKPRRKIQDEVNIVVGYSFKTGSNVRAATGSTSESLFTAGREAWAYDPEMDGRLVAAMKRGTNLAVNGTSARGTGTSYEFSLFGFSAAYDAISKACKIG